jgi:plasmid stabilization system protein ParE
MRKVRFRSRAWEDIQESAEYVVSEGSVRIAERFLDAIEEITQCLASLRQMGAPCRFSDSQLLGVRRLPVTGF